LQYEPDVEGRVRSVVVRRVGGGFAIAVDGRQWHVNAARIDENTLSLIVCAVPPNGDNGEMADPQLTPDGAGPGRQRKPDLAASGGVSYDVTVAADAGGRYVAHVGATPFAVMLNGGRRRRRDDGGQAGDGPQQIAAPMPGKVVRVLVKNGDTVLARQPLVVVEAMKMENELRAGRDGTVAEVHAKEGASVDAGALLVEIR
jgi:biotin carboxyl carrier protein